MTADEREAIKGLVARSPWVTVSSPIMIELLDESDKLRARIAELEAEPQESEGREGC